MDALRFSKIGTGFEAGALGKVAPAPVGEKEEQPSLTSDGTSTGVSTQDPGIMTKEMAGQLQASEKVEPPAEPQLKKPEVKLNPSQANALRELDRLMKSGDDDIVLTSTTGSGGEALVNDYFKSFTGLGGTDILQGSKVLGSTEMLGMFTPTNNAGGTIGFAWEDGPVTRAMREGKPVVIHDVGSLGRDGADTLATIAAKGKILLPTDEEVKAEPGFRLVMTDHFSPYKGRTRGDITPFAKKIALDGPGWAARQEEINNAVGSGGNVLIEGPPASGKLTMLREAAGSGSYRINLSGDTDNNELLGHYTPDSTGRAQWVNGSLTKAMEEGKPLILDGLEAAPKETLKMLEMLNKHGRIPLAAKGKNSEGKLDYVNPKKGFQILATLTPSDYEGRTVIPDSFREIFNTTVTLK